jgi:hypothetical protein
VGRLLYRIPLDVALDTHRLIVAGGALDRPDPGEDRVTVVPVQAMVCRAEWFQIGVTEETLLRRDPDHVGIPVAIMAGVNLSVPLDGHDLSQWFPVGMAAQAAEVHPEHRFLVSAVIEKVPPHLAVHRSHSTTVEILDARR